MPVGRERPRAVIDRGDDRDQQEDRQGTAGNAVIAGASPNGRLPQCGYCRRRNGVAAALRPATAIVSNALALGKPASIFAPRAVDRRDGRVAEGARLESVYTGNRIVGSNPTPSANGHILRNPRPSRKPNNFIPLMPFRAFPRPPRFGTIHERDVGTDVGRRRVATVFQTLNRLSQLEVTNAKVGMHADGGGLYLQVTKTAPGQADRRVRYRRVPALAGVSLLGDLRLGGRRGRAVVEAHPAGGLESP